MTIKPEITGEKQHNVRFHYFGAEFSCSRKLIFSFFPKKHYVVLGQLLRFYLDRGIRQGKLHRPIRFNLLIYVYSYIANITAKRQQFKHDDVKKSFYKLMNNAPYGKTIDNVARRTDIRLLNNTKKARRMAENPHCVGFRVFDGQVALLEEQIDAAAADTQS